MKAKKSDKSTLFNKRSRLVDILNLSHPLCTLANELDWLSLEDRFGEMYDESIGRPGKEVRLMVGLHYLKYTKDASDDTIVSQFLENPYYQYFCGNEYFEHHLPLDPSSMSNFRKRLSDRDLEGLLEETIKSGLKLKIISKKSFRDIIVDTTVQEKNVTFPTDSKLYYRMLCKLVAYAKNLGIELRQSYTFVSKYVFLQHGRYIHAKQFKRAKKALKKLKTYLGRVYRDILRKIASVIPQGSTSVFVWPLILAGRLLKQTVNSKKKLYSLHEADVACISKGKSHKRYEFGNKVSLTTTSESSFIVGALSFSGNPYDGHTLKPALEQTERIVKNVTRAKITDAYVDQGYKGHKYKGEIQVTIQKKGLKKKVTPSKWKRIKRRSSIEPIIGHLKEDGRLKRNFLKGVKGDRLNLMLAACGQNMRKLLKALSLPVLNLFLKAFLLKKNQNVTA